MTIDAEFPVWAVSLDVAGVIARVDDHTIGPLRRLQVPIVDVRCRRSFPGVPRVDTDDRKVAEFAFDHLWGRGFRQFGYCGFRGAHYSEARLGYFRQLVGRAGCPLTVYETHGSRDMTLSGIEGSGLADIGTLSTWLASLERPSGLFVCNDIRGQQVLNSCRSAGLAVPDDIAVIGVDDDDAICPLSDPPLSSVQPDAERVGYRAAEVLDGMLRGGPAPEAVELVPPLTVVQRLSTQASALRDRDVAAARRFIREHATHGIDVGEVVEHVGISRRQLERRFRAELGRTPHEEITAVQIEKVKQLLRETSMTLEEIAPLAGYGHKEQLGAVFKRETGESPGAFRKKSSN